MQSIRSNLDVISNISSLRVFQFFHSFVNWFVLFFFEKNWENKIFSMEKEDTSESPIISNETAKKFKPYCYGLILLIVIGVTTGFAIYFFSGERSYHFSPDDPNSYASTEQFISQNFSLDWFINFEKKQIVGSVTHTFLALQAEQTHLFLDTEKIEVTDVFNEKNQTLEFTLLSDKFASIYGSKLLIILRQPPKVNTTFTITIFYKTHPNATALSWLSPEQTSNKTLNYLFTQCQFIYCRSIIPLQDTPFVKAKYTAKVTVSNPENSNIKYKVFMSANLTNEVHNGENSTYYFTMDIPIPSYLIAIIVGNVEKKKIGKRTSLIAEPNDIEFYAEELAQTDDFLNALEDYLGAYAWGPFNIAVLPPPFPIGGMENPLLTFVSPTIIVGDKSQIWLAIHEMTHSWTGNLVTCKTNEEFWLNEGFTVFIERKITPLFTNESEICNISAHIGNRSMIRDMERFGFDHPFSALVPNLKGRSPTEAYSDVPYEKGFQFLTYLEMKIGLNNFHEFLKQYIDHFSRKSLNSKELKIFFEDFVKKVFPSNSTEILKQID